MKEIKSLNERFAPSRLRQFQPTNNGETAPPLVKHEKQRLFPSSLEEGGYNALFTSQRTTNLNRDLSSLLLPIIIIIIILLAEPGCHVSRRDKLRTQQNRRIFPPASALNLNHDLSTFLPLSPRHHHHHPISSWTRLRCQPALVKSPSLSPCPPWQIKNKRYFCFKPFKWRRE